MHRRPSLHLLVVAVVVFVAGPAWAGPRDAAAKKKIDEAISNQYVATHFDKAEVLLVDAISDCRGQCSPAIVAKAWMYVGVVRGGGKNDQKGAREAFANALHADPNVELDEALATPQTKKSFAQAQREQSTREASMGSGGGGEAGAEGMDCTPKVSEVQTRRPIPVSCTGAEGAKKVELHYKAGGAPWKSIRMKKKKETFQATIPCKELQKKGSLRFYVRAHDENGDPAGGYQKKANPAKISIVRDTDEEPPSFPDKEPPSRCSRSDSGSESESESEGGGASCESSDDCESGQSCVNGSCAQGQSCDVSADCPSGKCVEGKCEAGKAPPGPFKENWIGIHIAYDLAIVGGTNVCSQASQRDSGFACFYQGTEEQYRFNPHPSATNDIHTGLVPATYRALLSFDHLLSPNISAGVRLGYAFGGGPASGSRKDVKFFPYHFELRASYWFGDSPLSKTGFRPYLGIEAGAAQVDAHMPMKIGDCAGTQGGPPSKPGAQIVQDATYYQQCTSGQLGGSPLELDAYKKLGKGFVGGHIGVVYAFSPDSGIQLNLNVMQMMPTTGQAIEPSLGYVQGI